MSYDGARVTITRAVNGWIVSGHSDKHLFVDPVDNSEENIDTTFVLSLRDALYQAIDELSGDPGDHAKRRLYLTVLPGDEREDYPRGFNEWRNQ